VTPDWTPKHNTSHDGLLDYSRQPPDGARFDAIVVPTRRPVRYLDDSIGLASITAIPLIVACSKRVDRHQVIEAAARRNVEVYAVDWPAQPANPLKGISFETSTDKELLAFTSGLTRDLSAKRNLGLVIARMCGWKRLMFLDDDIQEVSEGDVAALAAGLNDHNVSALIPDWFPDNSVACHAYRLGGGDQGRFASGGGMGVRCDREELGFFPNIYNEDWFFFSEEAATHKIAKVGTSRQREYDPYADPQRAVKEEFGDLLAEGLYARLDKDLTILSVDVAYWGEYIKEREDFLEVITEMLTARLAEGLDSDEERITRAAQDSIRAARSKLKEISPELCQKFIDLWQEDLVEWRGYLAKLPQFDSAENALDYLGLDYAVFPSPSTR
jgi:glycosyltransferase involved in cell wall biosynthesis